MKKEYIAPAEKIIEIGGAQEILLETSSQFGLQSGDSLGDEFSITDVSYTKQNNSFWDSEW